MADTDVIFNAGTRQQVAFDMAKFIAANTQEKFASDMTTDEFLALYDRCLRAVSD